MRSDLNAFLIITFTLLFSVNLFAEQGGGRDGSGGGVWACINRDDAKTIRWMSLIDIWEGINDLELNIPIVGSNSHQNSYERLIEKALLNLKNANEDLALQISAKLKVIRNNHRRKVMAIRRISDANYTFAPEAFKDCLGGEIAPLQIAIYQDKRDETKVTINEYLFSQKTFSETDRAALFIHEAVYVYLRESFGDKTSDRARKIVALLFSTLDSRELVKRIGQILEIGELRIVKATINGVALSFAEIPNGRFDMGTYDRGVRYGRDNETLKRAVGVRGFQIATTEVTQELWEKVMHYNPSHFKGAKRPVEKVSFYDVQTFIAELNAKNDGYIYRLPTEEEWEYAARAGTDSDYFFDSASDLTLSSYANFRSEATLEVGKLKPNQWGLYDIYGNVWEWTSTPYASIFRIIRGGSWNYGPESCRSAAKNISPLGQKYRYVGFRLVRERAN